MDLNDSKMSWYLLSRYRSMLDKAYHGYMRRYDESSMPNELAKAKYCLQEMNTISRILGRNAEFKTEDNEIATLSDDYSRLDTFMFVNEPGN